MSMVGPTITYNILVLRKGNVHYVKAGHKTLLEAPSRAATIALDLGGAAIRGVIDQVYTPPGCDEHCIGTLFVREL